MEQKSRKEQEQDKLVELYDNVSISNSFHDRALENLKKAEREHNSMKKSKEKITYIEDIAKQKNKKGKLVAAGFVAALLITGVAVLVNMGGNSDKSVAIGLELTTQTPTPIQEEDGSPEVDADVHVIVTPLPNDNVIVTPLPNGDVVEDTEHTWNEPDPWESIVPMEYRIDDADKIYDINVYTDEEYKAKEKIKKMLHLFVTPPDGYGEIGIGITKQEVKGTLAYYNGKDNFEVYKVIETSENEMGTNLIVIKCSGVNVSSLKEEYLLICCVDEEYEQKMDVIRVPLTNMSYELTYKDEKLDQIQYMDANNTLRGTFTLNSNQWSVDDNAMIQILAIEVSNAYFSGDIEKVKELVQCDENDIIVCEENILDTMQPYLIKWYPEYVNRQDAFGVSCQFYGPQDVDSYTYLSLEMKYENDKYVVTSMGLEK